MPLPLRVLIIEDSEADASLMLHTLRHGGYEVTFERVDTAEAMSAALDTAQWDVILSDYSMPSFNAPAALRLLQEKGLDIPFIIVSGTVSEDIAVQAMKSGAHDFFAKHNLVRLLPAIERERREAEERYQRRRAEVQLRQSEERFVKAFKSSPIGITISTAEGRYLDVNEYALELFGYSRSELSGYTSLELGLWATPEQRAQVGERLVAQGSARNIEGQCRTKTGELRDVLASFEIITLDSEVCVLTTFQDITERKQAEQELTALYNATSYLFKADSLLNLGHQIVRAVVQEFDYADCGLILADKIQSKLVRMARAGDYTVDTDAALPLDGQSLVAECVRSGKLIYVPDVSADTRYANNQPQTQSELVVPLHTVKGVLGVLDLQSAEVDAFSERDQRILTAFAERAAAAVEIMELNEELNRHAVELEWRVGQRTAELQRTKERVEAILDNSSDAILVTYADGTVEQANPAFGMLFAYHRDPAFECFIAELVAPHQMEILSRALHTVAETRQPKRMELVFRRTDGSVFDGDLALAPVEAHSAEEVRVICSLRDITERKRAEHELRRALEKEKELGELKSRFTSMVSHEFRTPLASIQVSSDLLNHYGERLNEDQRQVHFSRIQAQVRRLNGYLEDILTLGRAETVGIDFKPAPMDIQALCKEVVEEMQLIAEDHLIEFVVAGTWCQIWMDRKLIRQAITNLLSNAIKYSPSRNPVRVELECGENQTVIRVHDRGIGIPEEDQPRLFEAFHRAKNVGTISGTGLGLMLVKRAVEAHGGSISLESQVGQGTTFTVTIARALPTA